MNMKMVLLAVLLGIGANAHAAILEVSWRYPTGRTIEWTRVEYGSCSGTKFGALKSWQVLPASIQLTHFTQVPRKTACTRAIWIAADGKRYTSTVSKARP
jgi:hypothetical protein